jgi:phage tail-like protein
MPEFEILTANRFYVGLKLDNSNEKVDGIFLECQGLKRTQDAIEICEVTPNKWGKATQGAVVRTKIPGNVKSGNVTLKRGMTCSKTLWNWFQSVQDGNWSTQRREADLSIYDQAGKIQARFNLGMAWPSSYKIADLNARGTTIEIEELEIAYETFERVDPQGKRN